MLLGLIDSPERDESNGGTLDDFTPPQKSYIVSKWISSDFLKIYLLFFPASNKIKSFF